MRTIKQFKVPYGTAKMVRVTSAKYLAWEDAFAVDFEDGLSFLEPHHTVRKANHIAPTAAPVRVDLDEEPCIGFFVHYDNGQTAEVSWSFIRELPPPPPRKVAEVPAQYPAKRATAKHR